MQGKRQAHSNMRSNNSTDRIKDGHRARIKTIHTTESLILAQDER